MRAVDIIARKRDGNALTPDEISWLIQGIVDGSVADYQAAAWLMAVYLRGMNPSETVYLTRAMADSGQKLDLGSLAPRSVDKHSTGGVGDKISLVAAPIAAAAGVVVPKMSGRGLGMTGGTLDKLESIPGLRVNLTIDEFRRQAADIGIVIASQNESLAPADGILYSLRDVTATVECLPLIVSSILSKKIAGGAPSIVLDVKAGKGAFLAGLAGAQELARSLVAVGTQAGKKVVAYVTRMDQPLGSAVGNALEVREAIDVLRSGGPADVRELALTLAGEMIESAGLAATTEAGRLIAEAALASGAALAKLRELIEAQGGDGSLVTEPERLPVSPHVHVERATRSGFIAALDAGVIGGAVVAMGAGRAKKTDQIDHGVGVVFTAKVGDAVDAGDELFYLYLSRQGDIPATRAAINQAYSWSERETNAPPLIVERIATT